MLKLFDSYLKVSSAEQEQYDALSKDKLSVNASEANHCAAGGSANKVHRAVSGQADQLCSCRTSAKPLHAPRQNHDAAIFLTEIFVSGSSVGMRMRTSSHRVMAGKHPSHLIRTQMVCVESQGIILWSSLQACTMHTHINVSI